MTEQEMVAGAQEGLADAQAQLVNLHKEPVFGFLYRYVGNADDAEDLCQEVFIRALGKIGGFRLKSRLGTWLFAIAANVARDHLRRETRRRKRREAYDEAGMSEVAADCESGCDEAVAEERNGAVRDAVALLPERERTAVLLRTYQEYDYQEIAEVLGCSVRAVGPLLYRARRRLAENLSTLVEGA